jgi:hypothetical protein
MLKIESENDYGSNINSSVIVTLKLLIISFHNKRFPPVRKHFLRDQKPQDRPYGFIQVGSPCSVSHLLAVAGDDRAHLLLLVDLFSTNIAIAVPSRGALRKFGRTDQILIRFRQTLDVKPSR